MRIMQFKDFELIVMSDGSWNTIDDNLDVQVRLKDGKHFAATLFTIMNISTLFRKFEVEGDCASGTYFWAIHAIILRDLSLESINDAIQDLIESNNIDKAMLRLDEF